MKRFNDKEKKNSLMMLFHAQSCRTQHLWKNGTVLRLSNTSNKRFLLTVTWIHVRTQNRMKIITTSLTTIQTLVYMKVYFKTFPKSGHLHKSDKKRRSYDHFKKEVKCCFGCGRRAQHEGRWACTIRPENGWALSKGRWACTISVGGAGRPLICAGRPYQ